MRDNKNGFFIDNVKFDKSLNNEIEKLNLEQFSSLIEMRNYINKYNNKFDRESEELPFTRFEYNSLKEVVEAIVDYNYKVDDKEYLREAFIEFYKKFRNKNNPIMLKKVDARSNETANGYAFGMYGLTFLDDPQIYIANTRKLMYQGEHYISIKENHFGFSMLSTFIHEMQHEVQDSQQFRFIRGDKKMSKKDLISTFYRNAFNFNIGKFRPEYYNRYYEFEANYVAMKSLYNFLQNDIISNTKYNKLKLYEMVCRNLKSFDMKKIIAQQKRYTKQIFEKYNILIREFDKYDTLNSFATLETILQNDKYISKIYKTALMTMPKDITTREKFDLLFAVYDEDRKYALNEKLRASDLSGLTEKEIEEYKEKCNKEIEKQLCHYLRKCIKVSLEANIERTKNYEIKVNDSNGKKVLNSAYNDYKNANLEQLLSLRNRNINGKFILDRLPKSFDKISDIQKFFDSILVAKPITEFEKFFEITSDDIDKYSNKLLEEYKDLENMCYKLQKDILNSLSEEEIDYMYANVSKSKYGNAENNSKYMTHIENRNSFNYGKSNHFIVGCLQAWEHTEAKKQAEKIRQAKMQRKQEKANLVKQTQESQNQNNEIVM